MQIASRFTIAVHILTCIEIFRDEGPCTSESIAGSVGVNPVVIRRVLGQLKDAGMVRIVRGVQGGAVLAKPLDEITLFDVYEAVDSVNGEELFHFHDNPNPDCPVGRNIHAVLDGRLHTAQKAMEDSLKSMRLSDVVQDAKACMAREKTQEKAD